MCMLQRAPICKISVAVAMDFEINFFVYPVLPPITCFTTPRACGEFRNRHCESRILLFLIIFLELSQMELSLSRFLVLASLLSQDNFCEYYNMVPLLLLTYGWRALS